MQHALNDAGTLIGYFIGSCIIPFVFCFIGGMIGRKTGAWIAAFIAFAMLAYGMTAGASRVPALGIFILALACAAMGWLWAWLSCKIKDRKRKADAGTQEERRP